MKFKTDIIETAKMPLVSIAIPCFKIDYLKESILSVVQQTYSNWELIIVNDASYDDIDGVVNSFQDARIRYYKNEINLGKEDPARNWNKCLELAQGEFFALLCDDDLYAPTFIEEMLKLANRYPLCGTFRTRANFIDAQGKETDKYSSAPEWESWEDYLWHVVRNYRHQTISEWMFRTDTIKKAGGYAILPLAWYADYLSVFKISKEGGIASTPKILAHFRQSGKNISSQDNKNTEKKIVASLKYREEVEQLLAKTPDKEDLLCRLDGLLRMHTRYNLSKAKKSTLFKLLRKKNEYHLHLSWFWKALWHNNKK